MNNTSYNPISGITINIEAPMESIENNMLYNGIIQQNGSSIPICCEKLDQGLAFFIDTDKSGDIPLEQLFQLAGGSIKHVPVLGQLDLFSAIKIDAFTTQFDPAGEDPTLVGFGILIDGDWEIMKDKLVVSDVVLEMYYKHGKNMKSYTGVIKGDVSIAQKPLQAALHLDSSDEMELTITALSDAGMPVLSDLVSLVSDSAGDEIEKAMQAVGLDGIIPMSLDVGFSANPSELHYVQVNADVKLFGIPVVVEVTAPDISILGKLKKDKELSLYTLLDKLSVSVPFLPNLVIKRLEFSADINNKSFSFFINCSGNCQHEVAGITMKLEDIDISCDYSLETKEFSGHMRSRTYLGDFELDLTSYFDKEDKDLSFEGRMTVTNDEEKVNLIKLVDTFSPGLIDIPDNLVAIEFSWLDIVLDQSGFNIEAEIYASIDIGIGSITTQSVSFYKHSVDDISDFGLIITSDNSTPAINVLLGANEIVIGNLKVEIKKENNTTISLLSGTASLLGSELSVNVILEEILQISASATNINLKAITGIVTGKIGLPDNIPDIVFESVELTILPATKEFTLSASSSDDWEIPLGVSGILVEDLQLVLSCKKEAESNTFVTFGSISGSAHIGLAVTTLEYNFPGELVFKTQLPEISLSPVIQDLCGAQSMMSKSFPKNISNITLSDITLTAAPQQGIFTILGDSPLGTSELIVTRNEQGKWNFIAAFVPPANWCFSAIDESLNPMDKLSLDNAVMVLSSSVDRSIPLSIIQLSDTISISKGLTFFSALDMSDLGIKDLMNVKSLNVSANIGSKPANIKLASTIDGSFKISDNMEMGEMKFFLKPSPSNFELGISGTVVAKIDKSDLVFTGTMGIRPTERSAVFAATMLGTWTEPFSIKGLSLSNVAIEVGIGIVPPPAVAAPIIGITGIITIGATSGNAAVKADTANPDKSMIMANFKELKLKEIIQTFCDKQVYNNIPADIRNTVLAAGLQDVAVYVVPQPTTIGELTYNQGFKFEGKLGIGDFDAQSSFLLSYSEGLAIKASMDPIKIGDAFVINGLEGHSGPTLDVDLRLGGKPGIVIEGLVKILGVEAITRVNISDNAFVFDIEGEIFNLFIANLNVSGDNLKSGGDIFVKAKMQNDLLAELQEKAQNGIQEATKVATKDIEKAQKKVDKAQNEVNSLQRNIDCTRKTIQAERNRAAKKVKDAENVVNTAQKKVNKLQNDINNMRNKIRKEREKTAKRLQDAQKKVSNAQGKVNNIQKSINSTKNRIKTINSGIAKKKKWAKSKKIRRWPKYTAYKIAKKAEISVLYSKIGVLNASKATANGVLKSSKIIVKGIEKATKIFPIDADPRIIGLFTAKNSANASLEVAKQPLKLLQKTIKAFPIDADPRIAALFASKETATLALIGAETILKGAKGTVGSFAVVGDFIVEHGLGRLLHIKEASFEGKLNIVKNGSVDMEVSLELLKKPLNMNMSFDFNDISNSIIQFVEKLMNEIK